MKDVVSTLPVLKNVLPVMIGSFFGCSRCLDLVWVLGIFGSISDSNGKKESD